MITCFALVCMFQTPSTLFADRMNYTIVDSAASTTLRVEWLTPDITRNTEGDTCWLYDGVDMKDCEPK